MNKKSKTLRVIFVILIAVVMLLGLLGSSVLSGFSK